MSENTFGALLGKLIYSKRKAMGLTQIQLAEDAYNTSGKTRRISELESGKVANPHPKTIDPIIVALGISDAQLEECAKTATTKVDPTLNAAYSEAEQLLNYLAEQFEAKLPDASLEELGQFLISKAEEYFALKRRIEAIENTENQVIELRREAMDALSNGNYRAVDDILKQAEEALLSSQTLEQIAKQVELRILRGDNAFLAGEMTECFKLFKSAALFYEAFDSLAMVSTLKDLAGVLYERGRRSLEPVFWVCEGLLEEALVRIDDLGLEPEVEGSVHYRLSLILRNQHLHEPQQKRQPLLEKAISHARSAVRMLSKGEDEFETVSAQGSLGNCLSDLCYLQQDAEAGDQAIGVLEEAKAASRSTDDLKPLLGHMCVGLGAAILRRYAAENGASEQTEAHAKAVEEFETALIAAGHTSDQEIWGTAQINLARLYHAESKEEVTGEQEAQFLRIRSISCFLAGIETYPQVQFPNPFAEAHEGLADVLLDQGLNSDGQLFDLYLMRAFHSFLQASEVFSKEIHPIRWARIQCRIGSVFGNHALRASHDVATHDLETAHAAFSEALPVFREHNDQNGAEYALDCLGRIEKQQAELIAV